MRGGIDSLTQVIAKTSVLAATRRLINDTENKFSGLILSSIFVERGILTEDVECNLRSETMTITHKPV